MVKKKTTMGLAAVLAMAAMVCLTGCPETDLSGINATGTIGFTSIGAPTITDETFDGGVCLTWTPVANAVLYEVYRDSTIVATVNPSSSLIAYDYADFGSNSLVDGETYEYAVLAYTDKDGLGGSKATKKIKVTVPAQGTQVASAANLKADIVNGNVAVRFDKPAYLNAAVTYAYKTTGVYDAFTLNIFTGTMTKQSDCLYTYTSSPYFAGPYTYKVTTSWAKAGYYTDNIVEGEFTVPTAGVEVPDITTADDTEEGAVIIFNDTLGAAYKLYRAEYNIGSTLTFTEVASSMCKTSEYVCEPNNGKTYTYIDTTVEMGKAYIYVLTGTLDGKAMEYNSDAKETVYHSTYPTWSPNFQAYHDGAGKVYLSWTVQDGWAYKIEKCVVNGSTHTESDLTTLAADSAAVVNHVKEFTDTITKTATSETYYKYTLIGTKNGVTKTNINDVEVYYYETYNYFPEFYSVSNIGDNTIDIKIWASKNYTVSTSVLKIYRAEVNNSSASYYLSDYVDVTANFAFDNSSDQFDSQTGYNTVVQYIFRDKTAKTSSKYYKYDVEYVNDGDAMMTNRKHYNSGVIETN